MQHSKTHDRDCIIVIVLACVVSIMLLANASSAYANTLVPRAKVLGDWEVSRVLITKNAEDSTPPPASGYARLIGLKFRVDTERVTSHWKVDDQSTGIAKAEGRALVLSSRRPLSIKVLFEDEKIARPNYFQGLVRGKASDYALRDGLGSLIDQPVSLYGYTYDQFKDQAPLSVTFAAVGSLLIMDYDEGVLLILRRPPKTKTTEHAAFCQNARSESDKFICSDRDLWVRYHYIQTTLPCAQKQPTNPNSNVAEALRLLRLKVAQEPKALCEMVSFKNVCMRVQLDAEANLIGSHIPSKKMCVNGEYKDLPL
jgi:hypothetical protein